MTKKPYRIVKTKVDVGRGRKVDLKEAHSIDGYYIGDPKDAERLWKKYGIELFLPMRPSALVCSVGWSPSKGLWFGWSHRAIQGFKTRREAAVFAESVS